MKKFDYKMPFKYIFAIIAFFSLIPIFMFDLRRDMCGNTLCAMRSTLNILKYPLEIFDLIGIIFILIGVWRLLVRFMPSNNRVVLEDTYCIFPGILQIFPEKKINYIDICHVEKVTLVSNQLIKIHLKTEAYPFIFSINNSMSKDSVEEFYNDLLIILSEIEKNNLK